LGRSALIDIARATAANSAGALALFLTAAARRQALCGDEVWFNTTADDVAGWISRGELFVASQACEIVAAMLLWETDSLSWPDRPEGEALFLHKLAVAPGLAGGGLSQAMLDLAQAEARRRGRSWLRLDCVVEPRLCAVYERAGFTFVDRSEMEGYADVHHYERRT